ncbi:putative groEL-like equatorial domain superfamily [Helianthus annuus]|nr:putative groEL-like equatorial domain superfamily [Helianthus annuus]
MSKESYHLCNGSHSHTIYSEGCKSVAAGMNAMDLRCGITMVVDSVVTNLKSRARMISRDEHIVPEFLCVYVSLPNRYPLFGIFGTGLIPTFWRF